MNSNLNTCFKDLAHRVKLLLAALSLTAVAIATVSAQSEAGVKAAFIYNFAKFTEWPATAFTSDNSPVTVGFVGADSLADKFEQIVAGKNANGRDFAVKKLAGATGAENCQIVFVGAGDQASAAIGAAKGKPVLTVGDSDGFTTAGGMITFVDVNGKVSFDMDLGAINTSGLKLDPKLRQVARSVKGG